MTAILFSIAASSVFGWASYFLMPKYPKVKYDPGHIYVDPVAPPPEPSSLWEPGCSAFWLDPDLWARTPMPERCWMYLDAPVVLRVDSRQRDIERNDQFGYPMMVTFGVASTMTRPVVHFYGHTA